MTDRLPPMFSFYGSKHRIAPKYPAPLHSTIVEPFAGSASYASLYCDRKVLLYDADPVICGVWEYLIRSNAKDILALPLLEPGQRVDSLNVCQEARWFIGFWLNGAISSPRNVLSKWGRQDYKRNAGHWGEKCRARIAANVHRIKHWRVERKSYHDIEQRKATWFIDPPYMAKGHHYRYSSKLIDYSHLASWCRAVHGQAIVCENVGATWLPFQPFVMARSNQARLGKQSHEAIYYVEKQG